jgi:hypothetical protein
VTKTGYSKQTGREEVKMKQITIRQAERTKWLHSNKNTLFGTKLQNSTLYTKKHKMALPKKSKPKTKTQKVLNTEMKTPEKPNL